jgi:hypothetical protein
MAPTSKTPYGPKSTVDYADPGYQSDGKARYPLDTQDHCRAAWSYINQKDNAAKYTADQLAQIKARIKAAGKKYGITFADEVKASAEPDLHGVELARPGPWKVASGNGEFTPEMLRDAADFFTVSGGQAVPVKLGHTDDRFGGDSGGDGDPTFGSVTNVRYVEDERGPVLLGDITGMPGWLAASAPKRWPNRSIEGWQDFTYEGREYSLVLTALAFLGVTPPAVRNIRSLSDLQTALAASARRLVASAPDDDPAEPPQTPAPEAEEPREGTGMDPVKIREALGLDPDASDDEVKAVMLTAAGAISDESPPEPAQPALFDDTIAPAAQPAPKKELVHAAGAPGTVVLASSVWDETQNTIKKLQQFVDKTQRDERDQVIAKAVTDGKFTPAQRTHFSRLWDADPTGTRALIDNLTRNSALAVMASGYVGEGDEDIDKEYAHLFPPQAKESSRG